MREENLITGCQWHIDKEYGINALNKYLHELELLNSGQVSAKDLFQRDAVVSKSGNTAIVKLSGVMQVNDGLCSRGIYQQVEEIEKANNDATIDNIVLYVNSGGGESQAGTILHNAIKDSQKPVYVVGEMIASAAYNASLAAKKIFLTSTMSQAGSIGSMITLSNEGLANYKSKFTEIYSDVSQGKNISWRKVLEGDMSVLQGEVTKNAEKFIEKVKEYRNVDDRALSGGVYYGEEAVEMGLIDGIMTLNEAIKFINNKNTDMNFSEKFTTLLNKVNSFFGWNAKDEVEVSQQMDSLGETFEAFKSNLTEQITQTVTEQLNLTELHANLQSMNDTLMQMTDKVNQLTTENAALTLKNNEMATTILDLRGRSIVGNNTEAPRHNVEQSFIDAFGNVTISNN